MKPDSDLNTVDPKLLTRSEHPHPPNFVSSITAALKNAVSEETQSQPLDESETIFLNGWSPQGQQVWRSFDPEDLVDNDFRYSPSGHAVLQEVLKST